MMTLQGMADHRFTRKLAYLRPSLPFYAKNCYDQLHTSLLRTGSWLPFQKACIFYRIQSNDLDYFINKYQGSGFNSQFFIGEYEAITQVILVLRGSTKVSKNLVQSLFVTSFYSIPYYSNMRLISKMYLEQNSRSITLDIHASMNERPPHLFRFKPHRANIIIAHWVPQFLKDIYDMCFCMFYRVLDKLFCVNQHFGKSLYFLLFCLIFASKCYKIK